jgi:hypothetical protein
LAQSWKTRWLTRPKALASTVVDIMPKKQRSLEEITASNKGAISSVVITARSLFLNRYLKVSFNGEMVGGNHIMDWRTDTYLGTLGLSGATVKSWIGRRVLDVGSGINFFGSEGRALGILVDRADLNLARVDVGRLDPAPTEIYAENMDLFERSYATGSKPVLSEEDQGLLARVRARQREICERYPGDVAATPTVDATNMWSIASSTYHVAVSVWMLAYLNRDQQKNVIREMIRVTRAGGQVRIYSGPTPMPYGVGTFLTDFEPDRRYSLKKHKVVKHGPPPTHGQFVIAGKCVTVDFRQSDGAFTLLVLNVGAYDPYYTYSLSVRTGVVSSSKDRICVKCKALHGPSVSVFYYWHRCRVCAAIYCPTCGGKLSNKGKQGWTSRERDCDRGECDGRTELI